MCREVNGFTAARGAIAAVAFVLLPVIAGAAPGEGADDLDCLIVPGVVVEIGSPTMGLLSSVPVDRGDLVEKGEVIAVLESGVERSTVALAQERADSHVELDAAKARLQYQSSQESRIRKLFKNKTVSQESLDKAETERELAEHELEEAKVNLRLAKLELERAKELRKKRTIVSPIGGVVMERELYVGEYVNETSHIMRIAQIDPLNVEVFVPLQLYGKVKIGTLATVSLKQPLQGRFEAMTIVVDYVMDPASSTFGVRLLIDNSGHTIPTGVKCRLRFDIQ